MKRAKIGFIGIGAFVNFQHLPNAAASDLMEVWALCDVDEDLHAERSAEYRPTYTTTDYRRVLSDPDIDIVVIGTKQDMHAKLAVEALQAGKWVYCEKPLCETNEECELVVDAERTANGRLAVGHNRRFSPPVQKARELLSRQEGPIFCTHRVVFLDLTRPGSFYDTREHLLYEGTHMFDLANYLMGDYPVSVFSSGDAMGSSYTIVEYPGGSRFCLHLGNNGSHMLEKEYIEVFRGVAFPVVPIQ